MIFFKIIKWAFLLLATIIFLVLGNHASKLLAGYYGLNVEKKYSADHFNFLKSHFEIVKPDIEKKYPTIIMFHPCGGPLPYLDDWQNFFKENGIASIQVDSYGPRNIPREVAVRGVCSGYDFQGQERAGDIYSILSHLKNYNWIDQKNIFVAGWSHGAYSLMDFMTMNGKNLSPTNIIDFELSNVPSLKGMILFYPHCGIMNLSQHYNWTKKIPSVVFLAELDGFGLVTQPEDCKELFNKMNNEKKYIDYYIIENATHVFDSEHFVRRAFKYNKKATVFSKNKIIDFVKSSSSKLN